MKKILFFAISVLLFTDVASSQEVDTKKYQKQITKVNDYINDLQNAIIEFEQLSNLYRGKSAGKIYIDRPGKVRWEYHDPKKMLILVNKNSTIFCDQELDQLSYIGTPKSAFDALLIDKLDIARDLKILEVSEDTERMAITLAAKEADLEDTDKTSIKNQPISLIFRKNPFHLSNIVRNTPDGEMINVVITDIKKVDRISKKLFELENPKAHIRRGKGRRSSREPKCPF